MTIEQIVEIPADRRVILDLPQEIPAGKAVVILKFKGAEAGAVEASRDAPRTASRLSERFAGALRVSDERYEEMQQALRDGRDEWNRNI